ncbi:MAG TPA: histidine kinase, partial [Vicinamibacterales bacterium]|nr:histidine kinase [Vicinamibacterales bacterium]
ASVGRNEIERIEVPAGRDEVAQLARAFAKVLDDLRSERSELLALSSELERRVAVRTREVERLAEESRYAAIVRERLKIARDLHDTLGHHLTALSLQLDVASRLSDGKAADHIRQAHAVARLLLGDVRDVVSRLRETRPLDLVQAIRALAAQHSDGTAIHVDLPETLAIDDSARSELLLRCVQEIITNTARHAHAQNLWIRLEARTDGIALHARDDGRGSDVLNCGNGLTGMRERFEQYAGHVEFSAGPGTGFEIRGFLPTSALA